MGCLNSKEAGTVRGGGRDEGQVNLIFQAKHQRANVFTSGVNIDDGFKPANIPKGEKQKELIRKALKENFVFNSLSADELNQIVNAMQSHSVRPQTNIIQQGEDGDFFYIIEKGLFSIIVDGTQLDKTLEMGQSFGELALMYDAPRAATIQANTAADLFKLDRKTFRYILAKASAGASEDIMNTLKKVPILSGLTSNQVSKLTDAVEMLTYSPGDSIFKKGDAGNIFYIIKSGKILISDFGVGSAFKDHTISAGEYFGERALLTGEPRAASATCALDGETVLIALDRKNFTSILGPLNDLLDENMNMRIIKNINIFADMSEAEKNAVLKAFTFETFNAGSTIIKENSVGDKFYIIKNGSASVSSNGQDIGELAQGTYFGEMALMNNDVRKATVVASSKVECFVLNRAAFQKIQSKMGGQIQSDAANRKASLDESEAMKQAANIKKDDLKTLAVLGCGTFGRVTLVQDPQGNCYALKAMLKKEIVAHKQEANVMQEKNTMIQCVHPFILRLYTTFKSPSSVYMLLEFVQGGELFTVLHTATSDGVPDAQAKFYAAVVIDGLTYMHNKNIAYRDMKPENCLIDAQGYPKIVDFGFAKVIENKSFTLCGTPEYLAPELVLGRGHNKSVDCWAFGILVYEMQMGYSPFADQNGMDQVTICRNIVNGKLVFSRDFNNDCKDLCKKLLDHNVSKRLGNLKGGCGEIMEQKWFKSIDWNKLRSKKIHAPWVPKLKSSTDTSNFDPYSTDDHVDDGSYTDNSGWDRDF